MFGWLFTWTDHGARLNYKTMGITQATQHASWSVASVEAVPKLEATTIQTQVERLPAASPLKRCKPFQLRASGDHECAVTQTIFPTNQDEGEGNPHCLFDFISNKVNIIHEQRRSLASTLESRIQLTKNIDTSMLEETS